MRNHNSILAVMLLMLLTGCVMVAPEPLTSPIGTSTSASATTAAAEPTTATPADQSQVAANPAKATLLGKVISNPADELKPVPGTVMWLAQVHWNADKSDGAFVLNGAESPSATIKDDSSFAFTNVPPGNYAIIVGDPMGVNAIVLGPDGSAKVVTLEAGKTLDVGELEVQMTSTKS